MAESYIADWRGKVRVIEQPNGVKVELVEKPSQKYLDWLETVKPPPEYEYQLAREIELAPDLPTITVESKILRFPRELTPSEETTLETQLKMKVKAKRKI